jgi:ribosome assembly protein RRB1
MPDLTSSQFPATAYLVAGTQADEASANAIALMKVSDLHRMSHENDGAFFSV